MLTEAEFAINNTTSKSTGYTPSRLLFGVDQRGPNIDRIKEYIEEKDTSIERDLESIREEAGRNILKGQNYNQNYFDKHRKRPHQYKKGDYVGIRNFDSTPGAPKKLIPAFKGPYEVTEVLENDRYVVEDVENSQTSQRPYRGTWEAKNIRPWHHGTNGYVE